MNYPTGMAGFRPIRGFVFFWDTEIRKNAWLKANFSIQTGICVEFLFVKSGYTGQFIFLTFKQMLLLP